MLAESAGQTTVKVGVVGAGYWGPNLIRNFADLPGTPLAAICDLRPEQLTGLRERYPWVRCYADYEALLADADIDAVAIATPAQTHHALARQALQMGKHVLVEKPLATSTPACRELIRLAEAAGRTLMVGHTFLYNDGLAAVKHYLDGGELGEVLYLYSRRLSLGQVRQDINVVWNLAPHDVSIMLHLLGARPARVSARGLRLLGDGLEDVAFLHLEFPAGQVAHVHVSWLDPHKVREVVVVGTRKMIVYDDVDLDHVVRIYDKGVDRVSSGDGRGYHGTADDGRRAVTGARPAHDPRERSDSFGEFQLLLRTGDLLVPKIRFTEPLRKECAHFVACAATGARPLTDGYNGLQVVRVLEAADESMRAGGASVPIRWDVQDMPAASDRLSEVGGR